MTDNAPQRARELFESGFYCAESVLMAIMESRGIESDLIPKIATGFCSGLSRSGGMCGAVSGAIMAVSLSTGRTSPDTPVDKTYDAVNELLTQFSDRFGSLHCQPLLGGVDIGDEEGRETFASSNLIEHCKDYAEEATRLALAIIDDRGEQDNS